MTKTFTVQTDGNGFYQTTQTFRPPAPFGFHVEVFATLETPTGEELVGSVQLHSPGSPDQAKSFLADSGVKISLGSWKISSGDNILVIQGHTVPTAGNTLLTIDVEADLTGF